MTAEVVLFILVGFLTIGAAGLMLVSKNAVHSALFMILNFFGVALLYLMLEAPFLALVQIAVYAGAIMVLFLFVIMLLGAEKTGSGTLRRFPWLPPVGMGLAAFLVIVGAWAFGQGSIDSHLPPAANASVRFVHAAPAVAAGAPVETAETADTAEAEAEADTSPVASRPTVAALPDDRVFALYIDDILVDAEFKFGENSGFVAIPPGAHTVALRGVDGTQDLRTSSVDLASGSVVTVVLAGQTDVELLSVVEPETSGLTVVNVFDPATVLSIGDLQNELFDPKMNSVSNVMTGRNLRVVVDSLPYGAAATTVSAPAVVTDESAEASDVEPVRLQYPAGFANWIVFRPVQDLIGQDGFVADGDQLRRTTVLRLTDALKLRAGEGGLVVIAPENRSDGSVRAVAYALSPLEVTAFGSPAALGERLFTDYLLPFQLVALLLLAAMVGVIVITYRGEHVPKPSRTTRRKVSRPLTSVIASQTGADLTGGAPQLPESTETPAGD